MEKLEGYYLIYVVWFLMELYLIVCLVGEHIKQTLIKTIRKYFENTDNSKENEIVDNIMLVESRLKRIIKIQYYGFYILNIICYLYQLVYILEIIDYNQKHKQKVGFISVINRWYSFSSGLFVIPMGLVSFDTKFQSPAIGLDISAGNEFLNSNYKDYSKNLDKYIGEFYKPLETIKKVIIAVFIIIPISLIIITGFSIGFIYLVINEPYFVIGLLIISIIGFLIWRKREVVNRCIESNIETVSESIV